MNRNELHKCDIALLFSDFFLSPVLTGMINPCQMSFQRRLKSRDYIKKHLLIAKKLIDKVIIKKKFV